GAPRWRAARSGPPGYGARNTPALSAHADTLQRGPFGRLQQRLRRRRQRRQGVYHGDAGFRIGMVAQNFHAWMDGGGDAGEHRPERTWVTACTVHQFDAVAIGGALDFA